MLALIGEAQHDQQMARTFPRATSTPSARPSARCWRAAVTSGELAAELDIDAALDALCGPIFYRALTGTPIPRAFIDRSSPTTSSDTSHSPPGRSPRPTTDGSRPDQSLRGGVAIAPGGVRLVLKASRKRSSVAGRGQDGCDRARPAPRRPGLKGDDPHDDDRTRRRVALVGPDRDDETSPSR